MGSTPDRDDRISQWSPADGALERARDSRQLALIMLQVDELAPGSVCLDTSCPECSRWNHVPHMANDSGRHPHPYGTRFTPGRPPSRKVKPWRDWLMLLVVLVLVAELATGMRWLYYLSSACLIGVLTLDIIRRRRGK